MSKMRYLQDQNAWLVSPPEGESFEVLVAGGPAGPNAARMAAIEAATRLLPELRSQAISYLELFVEREKFAKGEQWFFEGLESGRIASETEDQLSMYFSIEGDIYGEWSVSFQVSGPRYYPVGFSRRQI